MVQVYNLEPWEQSIVIAFSFRLQLVSKKLSVQNNKNLINLMYVLITNTKTPVNCLTLRIASHLLQLKVEKVQKRTINLNM